MTTLPYEIAVKLKESGWKVFTGGEWIDENGCTQDAGVGVYIPTLEELLHFACGDDRIRELYEEGIEKCLEKLKK